VRARSPRIRWSPTYKKAPGNRANGSGGSQSASNRAHGLRLIPIVGDSRRCATHRHTHTPGTDAPAVTVGAASRWSPEPEALREFIRAALGPRVRVQPLRYRGEGVDPEPHARRSDPEALAAYLRDGWAMVAPLAHDLVTLDLDGCAVPVVLNVLDGIAARYGAHLAYRTNSGSPNSEHRAYAVPERRRERFFREAMTANAYGHAPGVRWKIEDRWARTRSKRGGKGLRLPGSAPLKQGGGVCWPLRADGTPVADLPEATRMIVAARRAAGLPPVPLSAAPTGPETGERTTPAPSSTRTGSAASAAVVSDSRRVGIGGEFTPSERAALETVAAVGQRSDAALVALRPLARRRGTGWTAAGPVVMSAPAFAKYAAGGEARARRWWELTAGDYAQWLADHPARPTERPEATPEQTDAVLSWLEAARVRLWDTYGVQRANRAWSACMFIGRVMLDGRGLVGRSVAVRDLVQWGVVESPRGGSGVLRDLEAAGLLVVHTDYDISAPLEARRWSLPEGADTTDTHGGLHTPVVRLPSLQALTSPGCQWLPPALRSVLAWSLTGPLRADAVASVLRVSVRSVRRWFGRLSAAGLVERVGDAWRSVAVERLEAVAGAAPEASADAAAAGERLEAARARVADDRAGWRDLWRSSVDAAGRLVWRFRPRRRPAVGRPSEAATCGDAASTASRSSRSASVAVRFGRGVVGGLLSAVQDALPGLEAPPGGWSSVRCSSAPAVLRRSGVGWARDGLSAPGAGEWPGGPPGRLRRPDSETETANSGGRDHE
jgi:hypothetical protein